MAKRVPVKVSRRSAEQAVRVLLRWAGDDPAREGLVDTPKRVVNAYRDWFSGYEHRSVRTICAALSRRSAATTR